MSCFTTILLATFTFPAWAEPAPTHNPGGNSPTATTLTTLGCTGEGDLAKLIGGVWVCAVDDDTHASQSDIEAFGSSRDRTPQTPMQQRFAAIRIF